MQTQKTSRIHVLLRGFSAGVLCLFFMLITAQSSFAVFGDPEAHLSDSINYADKQIANKKAELRKLSREKEAFEKMRQYGTTDPQMDYMQYKKKLEDDLKNPEEELARLKDGYSKLKKEAATSEAKSKKLESEIASLEGQCFSTTFSLDCPDELELKKAEFEANKNIWVEQLQMLDVKKTEIQEKEAAIAPLREKLKNHFNELKPYTIPIDTVETQIKALEGNRAKLVKEDAECGQDLKFAVEMEAGFERLPPSLFKQDTTTPRNGTYDPEYVRNLDTGTCFVWHGEGDNGRWYQLLEGDDSTGLMTALARQLYTFLAGTVGILSVLMIIVGGIQISTAGTNQEGLEAGKDRIMAAMAGLALLFLSSLILYTINPLFFGL